MHIEVNGDEYTLNNAFGKISFTVDEDTISVLGIFVQKKRCGIGTSLVKQIEEFAVAKGWDRILVPATPSKEAMAFWLKLGYQYVFSEDKIIGNSIMANEDSEYFIDTDSGIILLEKIWAVLETEHKEVEGELYND